MSYRILPVEVFAVLEGFLILSLVYAPAPWLNSFVGYTAVVLIASVVLGVALSAVAFAHCVLGWIGFRTHRMALFGLGIFCLTSSALWLDAVPSARAIFLAYGLLMTVSSLFVSGREPAAAQAVRHEPAVPSASELRSSPGRRAA